MSALVFLVLFIHSLPEGFAIGTAYASDTAGLSLFVILAIALQNVPEGTSVSIPMADAGFSRSQMFWAAVLTSAPQPVGAGIAFVLVESVRSLLPVSARRSASRSIDAGRFVWIECHRLLVPVLRQRHLHVERVLGWLRFGMDIAVVQE